MTISMPPHCDKASIARPERLYRNTKESLSRRILAKIPSILAKISSPKIPALRSRSCKVLKAKALAMYRKNACFSSERCGGRLGRASRQPKNAKETDKRKDERLRNVDFLQFPSNNHDSGSAT
jgi:hypothetical protein